MTFYLKYYYPVVFMTSVLNNQKNDENGTIDFDSMIMYLKGAREMGIEIVPPYINQGNADFIADVDNNRIYYGMKLIKGLSEKAMNAIISSCKGNEFTGFQDFTNRMYEQTSKSDVNALIKAGAFGAENKMECFKLFYEKRFWDGKEDYKPIKKANKNHIAEAYRLGLTTPENEDDKELVARLISEYRLTEGWKEYKDKYCKGTELDWEMQTLNIHLSGDPFEGVVLPDWSKIKPEENGWLGGVITAVKAVTVKQGKNAGKKMAFVNLDVQGVMADLVVYSNKYPLVSDLLKLGNCIVCKVTKDKKSEHKGVIQDVMLLSKYLKRTESMQRGKNE